MHWREKQRRSRQGSETRGSCRGREKAEESWRDSDKEKKGGERKQSLI